MAKKEMIIASSGRVHGQEYMEYILPAIHEVVERRKIDEFIFVPFARPGGIPEEKYTDAAAKAFAKIGVQVKNILDGDPTENLAKAKGIFVGGGNTFLLVRRMHQLGLMAPLRQTILDGTFYIGTSAGSNLAGVTMQNTNDMPIVDPITYKTLGVLAYNINAHYIEPEKGSTHMGETREQRIAEYHVHNNVPVVGLKEGSYIHVTDEKQVLCGELDAVIFRSDQEPEYVSPAYDFKNLN
jgi:dipeptidase E